MLVDSGKAAVLRHGDRFAVLDKSGGIAELIIDRDACLHLNGERWLAHSITSRERGRKSIRVDKFNRMTGNWRLARLNEKDRRKSCMKDIVKEIAQDNANALERSVYVYEIDGAAFVTPSKPSCACEEVNPNIIITPEMAIAKAIKTFDVIKEEKSKDRETEHIIADDALLKLLDTLAPNVSEAYRSCRDAVGFWYA